ncbi:hypothetical protein DAPPUDRAFT_126287, partial [Daphnia pulex]
PTISCPTRSPCPTNTDVNLPDFSENDIVIKDATTSITISDTFSQPESINSKPEITRTIISVEPEVIDAIDPQVEKDKLIKYLTWKIKDFEQEYTKSNNEIIELKQEIKSLNEENKILIEKLNENNHQRENTAFIQNKPDANETKNNPTLDECKKVKEDWEKCRTDKGNVATSVSAQTSTQTSLSTYVNPVSLPSTDNKYDIPSMFQHFADKMKGAANPEVMDKTLIEDFSREVTVHNNIKKLKNYTITMTLSLHEKIITEETVITEAAPEIGSPRVVGSNPPDPTKPLQRNNIPIGTESSVDPHSNAHDVDG